MSSDEEDRGRSNSSTRRVKRKGRACDTCRHKKVRCDGQPGQKCSNCVAVQHECTYLRDAKKRYPDAERIKTLETELANMRKLLNKLHPGVDFSRELSGILDENSLWLLDANRTNAGGPQKSVLGTPSAVSPTNNVVDDYDSSEDDIASHLNLKRSMEALTLNSEYPRYLGKSSRLRFYKRACDLKSDYFGQEQRDPTLFTQRLRLSMIRNKYWKNERWIMNALEGVDQPNYTFPEPDLLASLVELYFAKFNVFVPLLHRPTLQACLSAGLHFEDEGFGSLILMVCAMGSRFSDDPRVLAKCTQNWHSAGWPWFSQVYAFRKAIKLKPPRLYDLQIPCLVALYLHGTSLSQPSWPMVGVGLRLAQDMGAHRKRSYEPKPTVEGELLRRAFWTLVSLDRSQCFQLGRPCSLQDEDIDVDHPTECDDEYWIALDPEQAFKQPPGKPSTVSFFNASLRLKSIQAFCLRTIYSITKSKVLQGHIGPEWEHSVVSDIDSALNQWLDAVPEHLRWNPHQENPTWLNQSAFMYSAYYNTQINVHRLFIPSSRKPSPLSFPSLAICTNAARSCIHVVDVQHRAGGVASTYFNMAALFSSAIVLLLNIWGGKRAGVTSINPMKEMQEVHKAMDLLKDLEPRWYSSGRYWDVLRDLAETGDLPLPPSSNQKRHRDSEDYASPASTSSDASHAAEPRHFAGTRRAQAFQEAHQVPPVDTSSSSDASVFELPSDFVLPMYSEELSRMPQGMQESLAWGQYDMSAMFNESVFTAPGASGPQEVHPPPQVVPQAAPPAAYPTPAVSFVPGMSMCAPMPTSIQPYSPAASSAPGPPAAQTAQAASGQTYVNGFQTAPAGAGDTLAMWSTAPESFEWDEWGVFISSMNPPTNDS